MTDRVQYLTIGLDKEYRTDDAESIVEAIKMIKGVQDVTLGEPENMANYLAANSFRQEAYDSLFHVLHLAAFNPQKFKEIAAQVKIARAAE